MSSVIQTPTLPRLRLLGPLGNALLLLLGAVILSFFLFTIAPGDPARVILGPQAPAESVSALRRQLGLDRSVVSQLIHHIAHIASLDLGVSTSNGRPVLGQVLAKFAVTATIGLQAALLSLLASYGINLLFHVMPGTRIALGLLRLGVLMPVFLLTVLAAIVVGLLFPQISLSRSGAAVGPFTQILPSLIACLYPVAVMTTILRDRIESTAASPACRAARAAGIDGWRLFHYTLFRPSAVPWLAAWVNQLSLVFFASLVLEVILSIPGAGGLLLTAIQNRDYPVLQGLVLVNAALFVVVSLAAEWTFVLLDPRIRS